MKFIDYLLLFFLLSLIGIAVYVVGILKTNGSQCIVSPISYGIRQYEKNFDIPMSCVCSLYSSSYKSIMFTSNGSFAIK